MPFRGHVASSKCLRDKGLDDIAILAVSHEKHAMLAGEAQGPKDA
jgi:hypothetical protein